MLPSPPRDGLVEVRMALLESSEGVIWSGRKMKKNVVFHFRVNTSFCKDVGTSLLRNVAPKRLGCHTVALISPLHAETCSASASTSL